MRQILFIITILFSLNVTAQHCPWDGGSLIAVKLVNKKGQSINFTSDVATLMEIENPDTSLCTYAEGLLKKPLLNTTEFFTTGNRFGYNYGEPLRKRLKDMGVIDKSNLLVCLNQAETSCMIKKDGDFTYKTRKFVIVYRKGKQMTRVPVPPEAIRSLCTNNTKDFVGFEPIVVKVD
jgi:hypothetical protein